MSKFSLCTRTLVILDDRGAGVRAERVISNRTTRKPSAREVTQVYGFATTKHRRPRGLNCEFWRREILRSRLVSSKAFLWLVDGHLLPVLSCGFPSVSLS